MVVPSDPYSGLDGVKNLRGMRRLGPAEMTPSEHRDGEVLIAHTQKLIEPHDPALAGLRHTKR